MQSGPEGKGSPNSRFRQVSLRRTADISEFIGKEIEARIIKIDEQRMNIVVSRRKLVEEQREAAKKKLLEEIEEGEIRRGVVKNIADFGAFVEICYKLEGEEKPTLLYGKVARECGSGFAVEFVERRHG